MIFRDCLLLNMKSETDFSLLQIFDQQLNFFAIRWLFDRIKVAASSTFCCGTAIIKTGPEKYLSKFLKMQKFELHQILNSFVQIVAICCNVETDLRKYKL